MDTYFDARLEQARWAVRRWSAFPVSAVPRPLVLAGAEIVSPGGFCTGEAKDAFSEGRFEWLVEVPDDIRARLQYAAERRPPEPAGAPLKITHAGSGEYEFVTDRGVETLPAWWLRGPATEGPIWVLDPAVDVWQPPEGAAGAPPVAQTLMQPILGPIELEAGGRSIVVPWLGSLPQVETYPGAEIIETPTAVSAVAIRKDMGARGWVAAAGVTHCVPARLNAPLGNRVFVDLHGNAVRVTAATEVTLRRWAGS